MERHCENAQIIAEWLEKHPLVESIRFPGLKSHPHYQVGLKQHKGPWRNDHYRIKRRNRGRKIDDEFC